MEGMDRFIIILYAALVAFFVYRLFKGQQNKGKLTGSVTGFSRKVSTLELVLFAVLLITGLVNLFFGIRGSNTTNAITAGVMVLLAIVFMIASRNKLYIGENGIVANSNFYTFKELKKWGFDTESGDLVLQIKKDKQLSNEVLKVNKEDMDEINNLIRSYKLNK